MRKRKLLLLATDHLLLMRGLLVNAGCKLGRTLWGWLTHKMLHQNRLGSHPAHMLLLQTKPRR
jgi:hypothetical protein